MRAGPEQYTVRVVRPTDGGSDIQSISCPDGSRVGDCLPTDVQSGLRTSDPEKKLYLFDESGRALSPAGRVRRDLTIRLLTAGSVLGEVDYPSRVFWIRNPGDDDLIRLLEPTVFEILRFAGHRLDVGPLEAVQERLVDIEKANEEFYCNLVLGVHSTLLSQPGFATALSAAFSRPLCGQRPHLLVLRPPSLASSGFQMYRLFLQTGLVGGWVPGYDHTIGFRGDRTDLHDEQVGVAGWVRDIWKAVGTGDRGRSVAPAWIEELDRIAPTLQSCTTAFERASRLHYWAGMPSMRPETCFQVYWLTGLGQMLARQPDGTERQNGAFDAWRSACDYMERKIEGGVDLTGMTWRRPDEVTRPLAALAQLDWGQ
jgi:hypothetical protein